MEQLVARRAHNPKVVGSSPAPATTSLEDNTSRLFLLFKKMGQNNYFYSQRFFGPFILFFSTSSYFRILFIQTKF